MPKYGYWPEGKKRLVSLERHNAPWIWLIGMQLEDTSKAFSPEVTPALKENELSRALVGEKLLCGESWRTGFSSESEIHCVKLNDQTASGEQVCPIILI